MPFNNPIVAGDELIRNAIRSENFVSGEDSETGVGTGWSINRDGSAEFNNILVRGDTEGNNGSYVSLSASDSFTYQGDELSSLIAGRSGSMLGYHARTVSSLAAGAGVEQVVAKMNYTAPGGRMVYYSLRGGVYTNGGNIAHLSIYVRFTTDGSEPTASSALLRQTAVMVPGGGIVCGFDLGFFQFENVDVNMKTRVSFILNFPGGQTGQMFGAPSWPIEMAVIDVGNNFPNTGVNLDSGGGGAVTFRSFDIQPYASRSYRGSGSLYTPSSGDIQEVLMGGDIGADGNRRSWMWFDANLNTGGNGLGSLNDMQGASSIDYFEVYLYYPHWYNSSGGTAFIGHHNSNVVTNTEQGGAIYGEKTEGWPGRNIGKWVNLLGTGIASAALAGTIEGLVLGNTGSATLAHYGYAWGASQGLGFKPGLRAGYYK